MRESLQQNVVDILSRISSHPALSNIEKARAALAKTIVEEAILIEMNPHAWQPQPNRVVWCYLHDGTIRTAWTDERGRFRTDPQGSDTPEEISTMRGWLYIDQ